MAINSVEQVSIASLKQNDTSTSAAAKKASKQYQKLRNKGTSKFKSSSKVDTIEISEEGRALASLSLNKNLNK